MCWRTERPVALIAAAFVVMFLVDAVVLAAVNVFLWTVIPQVSVRGFTAGAAYNEVYARFRERPAWTAGSMAGVLVVAGLVTGVGLGGVALALAAVSVTELAGATELVLLRFLLGDVPGIVRRGDRRLCRNGHSGDRLGHGHRNGHGAGARIRRGRRYGFAAGRSPFQALTITRNRLDSG